MKKINILFLLTGLLLFTACESDESTSKNGYGYLDFQLNVDDNPEIILTRSASMDVDDFIIEITGMEEPFTYAELKEKGILELEEGSYDIVVYNSKDIPVHADHPTVYGAESSFQIKTGTATEVLVTCKRQEIEIGLDLSPLSKSEVKDLAAHIYLEGNRIFTFTIDQENKTNTHFFDPDLNWEIFIEGTYNGFPLGNLGGPHKILDISDDIDKLKGNTLLVIKVNGVEPVKGYMSGLTFNRVLSNEK